MAYIGQTPRCHSCERAGVVYINPHYKIIQLDERGKVADVGKTIRCHIAVGEQKECI